MKYPGAFHEIELRAYALWQERGQPVGTQKTDRFKAELELAKPEGALLRVARDVGTAIGTVVALVIEPMVHDPS